MAQVACTTFTVGHLLTRRPDITGVEVFADKNDESKGYVTWVSGNEKSWTMEAQATGPNALSGVSQRPITQEPMYLVSKAGQLWL